MTRSCKLGRHALKIFLCQVHSEDGTPLAAQVRRSAPGMLDVVLDPLDDTRVHPFSYSDAIDLAAAVTGADRAPPTLTLTLDLTLTLTLTLSLSLPATGAGSHKLRSH